MMRSDPRGRASRVTAIRNARASGRTPSRAKTFELLDAARMWVRARSCETCSSAGKVPGRSSASSTCSPPSTASPVACASDTAWRSVCRAASVSTRPSASRSGGGAGRGVGPSAGRWRIAVAPVHGLARDAEVAADRGERRAAVERADDVGPLDVVERLPERRDPPQRGMGVGRGLELGDEPPEVVAPSGGCAGSFSAAAIMARGPLGGRPVSRFVSCVWLRVHSGSGVGRAARARGWPDAPVSSSAGRGVRGRRAARRAYGPRASGTNG